MTRPVTFHGWMFVVPVAVLVAAERGLPAQQARRQRPDVVMPPAQAAHAALLVVCWAVWRAVRISCRRTKV